MIQPFMPTPDILEALDVNASRLHGAGDGVLSKVNIFSGQVVFTESPIYCQQTLTNKCDVLVCSNCLCFLGSELLQLNFLTRKLNRHTICDQIKSNSIQDIQHSCHLYCGELYCSDKCRQIHWERGHQDLCTGVIPEDIHSSVHPLILFKTHAVETNEIFLLIADVFSHALSLMKSGHSPCTVTQFFAKYVHNVWWDVVTVPSDRKPEEFKETLKQLAQESYSLLSNALMLREKNLEHILSFDFMARLIGSFEQNNVGVNLTSPLADAYRLLRPGSESVQKCLEAAKEIVENLQDSNCCDEWSDVDSDAEIDEQEVDDAEEMKIDSVEEDGDIIDNSSNSSNMMAIHDVYYDELKELIDEHGLDTIFPPLDGTAFYPMICKINHSCDPNVLVTYSSSSLTGLKANLTTTKPIEIGCELLQSYIDVNLDKEERQQALADYGFHCQCSRCLSEL